MIVVVLFFLAILPQFFDHFSEQVLEMFMRGVLNLFKAFTEMLFNLVKPLRNMPFDFLNGLGSIFAETQAFLMAKVNAAGQKAIIIGAALGVLATGLRIVLGIERSYLSE